MRVRFDNLLHNCDDFCESLQLPAKRNISSNRLRSNTGPLLTHIRGFFPAVMWYETLSANLFLADGDFENF